MFWERLSLIWAKCLSLQHICLILLISNIRPFNRILQREASHQINSKQDPQSTVPDKPVTIGSEKIQQIMAWANNEQTKTFRDFCWVLKKSHHHLIRTYVCPWKPGRRMNYIKWHESTDLKCTTTRVIYADNGHVGVWGGEQPCWHITLPGLHTTCDTHTDTHIAYCHRQIFSQISPYCTPTRDKKDYEAWSSRLSKGIVILAEVNNFGNR